MSDLTAFEVTKIWTCAANEVDCLKDAVHNQSIAALSEVIESLQDLVKKLKED